MAAKAKKPLKPKSHYDLLKNQWLGKHQTTRKTLHTKHKDAFDWIVEKFPDRKKLASSAIGTLMLTQVLPATAAIGLTNLSAEPNQEIQSPQEIAKPLLTDLLKIIPQDNRPLNKEEEEQVSQILSKYYEIPVTPEVDGKRLNRTYGIIGAEQHLVRFPGDTMAGHLEDSVDNNNFFISSGMAPGRGAWGYFAPSKSEFTDKDKEREKWYIAVQTFASPGYADKTVDYRDFFKYRKMLVVNPENGKAIVTDIADSGPATFTGKHLGGSPEVMYHLGLHQGPRKGAVLYFFISDPDDKIPLGPTYIK